MSLGSQLKDLRQSRNLTLDDMANQLNNKYKEANFSKGRLSRWENNKDEPRLSSLKLIADFYGKSLDYFFPKYAKASNIEYLDKHDKHIIRIPVIGTIACGSPILADQNIDSYTSELFDERPEGTLFALKCQGDSMEPKIPDGATVIVRLQPEVEDDEIAAVLVDNDEEATLKRVKHIPGGQIMLIPENKDYDPIILNKDNPGRILGKVIKVSYDL